ncbi:MAG TPA: MFS transporter [Kofleriaceae bacterium]|nr:MFS transporter [Kofleriaceae bacterium]
MSSPDADVVRSLVPARMDRLPWSAFHWRMVIALGITWILDGIEIGLAAAIGNVLRDERTLGLDAQIIGLSGGLYLLGEVLGALYFGRLADKLGRRKLFILTLGLYLIANAMTALSFSTWFFLLTRFVAGMGIGGEYAAIHSAIDELTPARYRGRVDIAIAGTYWAGAMIAAAAQILLLNPDLLPIDLGWRISLVLGPAIGLMIWPLRKYIPESPRWQLTHGFEKEAEATVDKIEADIRASGVQLTAVDPAHAVVIRRNEQVSYARLLSLMFQRYLSRTVLSLGLMITQSFLYNAIFFTYTLILADFYKVANPSYYIFPFALGNLLGPLLIGRFFDTVGRRKMISLTYCTSAVLLALSGWLFYKGALTAQTQVVLWCVIFFIASAAASSAYLTVSEIYPVEIRAQAISVVFATAQSFGATAPLIFGTIIAGAVHKVWWTTEVVSRTPLAIAYVGSAVVMFGGGLIAWFLGVDAEGKSLEDVAAPLSATETPHVTPDPHEITQT